MIVSQDMAAYMRAQCGTACALFQFGDENLNRRRRGARNFKRAYQGPNSVGRLSGLCATSNGSKATIRKKTASRLAPATVRIVESLDSCRSVCEPSELAISVMFVSLFLEHHEIQAASP